MKARLDRVDLMLRMGLVAGACLLATIAWERRTVSPVPTAIALPADTAEDDAHCGCGEEKMARVAGETQSFAAGVAALEHSYAGLASACHGVAICDAAKTAATTLAKDEAACRRRQLTPGMPMSREMRQWADACHRVDSLWARFSSNPE